MKLTTISPLALVALASPALAADAGPPDRYAVMPHWADDKAAVQSGMYVDCQGCEELRRWTGFFWRDYALWLRRDGDGDAYVLDWFGDLESGYHRSEYIDKYGEYATRSIRRLGEDHVVHACFAEVDAVDFATCDYMDLGSVTDGLLRVPDGSFVRELGKSMYVELRASGGQGAYGPDWRMIVDLRDGHETARTALAALDLNADGQYGSANPRRVGVQQRGISYSLLESTSVRATDEALLARAYCAFWRWEGDQWRAVRESADDLDRAGGYLTFQFYGYIPWPGDWTEDRVLVHSESGADWYTTMMQLSYVDAAGTTRRWRKKVLVHYVSSRNPYGNAPLDEPESIRFGWQARDDWSTHGDAFGFNDAVRAAADPGDFGGTVASLGRFLERAAAKGHELQLNLGGTWYDWKFWSSPGRVQAGTDNRIDLFTSSLAMCDAKDDQATASGMASVPDGGAGAGAIAEGAITRLER